MLECTRRIHVVTGVYTNLVGITRRSIGHRSIEMHIGNERNITATRKQLLLDVAKIHRLAVALSGETYQLTATLNNAKRLLHTAVGIHCTGVGH